MERGISMNDLLNPYASPQIPTQTDPNYEQRTICGRFVVDELTQRDAARGYQLRHVGWLVSSLLALPAILLAVWPFLPPTNVEFSVLAMGAGFIVGACISVAIHVTIDWSIFWHNLRQLRTHP